VDTGGGGVVEAWREVLGRLIPRIGLSVAGPEAQWAIIGSAATALQGCAVTPRDIDLLAAHPGAVHRFVGLMEPYTPERCEHSSDHADWHSSKDRPMSVGPDEYGLFWHFARWVVEGTKVEIAHIAAPEGFPTSKNGAGIWEAGPEIWPHIRHVRSGDHVLPVVPLEIQLGTCMRRGLEERAAEIVAVLRRDGYDIDLIRQALREEHRRRFEAWIEALT